MRKSILTGIMGAALLFGNAAQAVDATQKCQQAKLKAQGKLKSCLAKSAAGVIGGKADGAAECQTKFTTALQKADDKATAASTSCRYLDNGNGTVSDLNTGLVWEQKTASGIHSVSTTYTWSTGSPYPQNGTVLTTFLTALNGGTTSGGGTTAGCFTGHCDWRLPTIEELGGILLSPYPCGTDPCIDPAFGPTQSAFHWSASTDVDFSVLAWGVYFGDGTLINSNKTSNGYARAVRGGL